MGTPKIMNAPGAAPSIAAVSGTPDYSRPLTIVTTLFFIWGFLTSLNDILVPHLKAIFELSYARVMLVQFAFFSAYFLFSLPWSKIVNRIGYQRTMVVGLLTMAVGAFLFLPAASAASYPLFLSALVILAAGITGLQVAANPYVVVLGKPETASSRLLAWHHYRPENWWLTDPKHRAVRDRTVTATRATGSACLSCTRSGLGQNAIHRDRCSLGVIGSVPRHFQAAKDRKRRIPPGREG
jgi:hypothetical protein